MDIDQRSADVYRNGADGLWVLHPFALGETVELASVELRLPAAELFADIDPPAGARAARLIESASAMRTKPPPRPDA